MKSFLNKIFQLPVIVHLMVMMVVFVMVGYITLKVIDSYTNHNQAVLVPDVKGLQVEDAIPFLEKYQLRHVIIDSIYSREQLPGAIVELMPEANAKVKRNRVIYITINAKTEEMALIPNVTDISYREAYARVRTSGFKYVEPKYVAGEHLNLTIGVEYEGRMINAGTRLPLSARLILVVCDGNILQSDSITIAGETPIPIGDNESWF